MGAAAGYVEVREGQEGEEKKGSQLEVKEYYLSKERRADVVRNMHERNWLSRNLQLNK